MKSPSRFHSHRTKTIPNGKEKEMIIICEENNEMREGADVETCVCVCVWCNDDKGT